MSKFKSDKQRKKVMSKLSCKQLNYYKEDETKTYKDYKKLGLTPLAKDEKEHAKYFETEINRCKK